MLAAGPIATSALSTLPAGLIWVGAVNPEHCVIVPYVTRLVAIYSTSEPCVVSVPKVTRTVKIPAQTTVEVG